MSGRLGLGLPRVASWVIGAIPAGFGKPRFADPIYRHEFAEGQEISAKARLRGGACVELDLRDRIQGMTFLTRDYEPALVRFLASQLPARGTFLDIGAHVGLVSLSVAARCHSRGVEVHAFEPDPDNAAAFRRNLQFNPDLNVQLNEAAVGEMNGRVTLRRIDARERACATIVSSDARGNGEAVEVRVVSLASHLQQAEIERVDVLKIDVEGYEPRVLQGAEPLLRERRVGCVVCEMNDQRLMSRGSSKEELCDLLRGCGYQLVPIPQLGLRRVIPRRPEDSPDEDVAFRFGGHSP